MTACTHSPVAKTVEGVSSKVTRRRVDLIWAVFVAENQNMFLKLKVAILLHSYKTNFLCRDKVCSKKKSIVMVQKMS